MTLRRGVTLVIALCALAGYVATHINGAPAAVATTQPYLANNDSLIIEPDAGVAPIVSLIEEASSSVDLVMYELEDTEVEQALVADKARGLSVRVLLNGGYYGKKENTQNDAAYQYLLQNGVDVHWTPAYFALTHQKTLVVDRDEAVIMTMNLTPQYYATSREFNVVDTDPNDVSAIESTFEDDWNGQDATAENGDDLIWSPGSESALIALIASAQKTVDIYNEEMADTKVEKALEDAAQRGVTVRIDMTYSSEWKSAFAALAQAGALVRTYAANAPLYIHAKIILVDDSRAFVGSENFSLGSLEKNRELGIIITDPNMLGSIESTFEKDWAGATPFTQ